MRNAPWFPYIAPFAVFMGFLALHSLWALPDLTDQIVRVVVMTAVIWFFARPVLDLRVRHVVASTLIGVGVIVIWVAPDFLIPGYRSFVLFNNSVVGKATSSLAAGSTMSWPVIALRMIRAVIIVPIIEELFWRAWMMRWLINPDFEKVPLGTYSAQAFWIVAVLFASEHGSYWDVGLICGIVFNWWMVRTKSLGDLIFTHAIANLALSLYVIATGKWEFWL